MADHDDDHNTDHDDTRSVSQDRMRIGVGEGAEATRFLEKLEAGDMIVMKTVTARILGKNKGDLDLQVEEVLFDQKATQALNRAGQRKATDTDIPEESPDIAIILSVPEPEEITGAATGNGNRPRLDT